MTIGTEPRAFWLTDREIDIVQERMRATYLGSGFLNPEAKLPIDVFFAPKSPHPFVGIYKEEDGKPYVTDASDVFFPRDEGLLTVIN